MNNPLRTPEDYELFLYTLTEQFPSGDYSATLPQVAIDDALPLSRELD
jgi:hypothetical protein